MRKFLSMAVVTAVAVAGMPLSVLAAGDDPVAVVGTAYRVDMQPLAKAEVQVRDLKTGSRVNSTFSDAAGSYSFKGLQPGNYVVEIVNSSGRVIGMSAPFVLGATSVTVSVVAVAQGTAASGEGAGFSFLGLGPVSSLAVIGAAGAAAMTAVVATRPDASPSR